MTQGKTKTINHVVRRQGNKVLNFMKSKEQNILKSHNTSNLHCECCGKEKEKGAQGLIFNDE